ncbi:Uncharacterised protein [Kocuria rosea]|nr:Uncharacterised protein [Kocuria rosea]
MIGKWKHMWHSGSCSLPKYSTTSCGIWFASAITTRPGYWSSIMRRSSTRKSWVPGRFSQLVPSSSIRYGIASARKPSMPMSSQNFTTSWTASTTAGFSKLRSGWWEKKRCQKNCRRIGSNVQFDSSVSTKMIRASWYSSSVSDQT